MPRLTDQTYLLQHHQLRSWLEDITLNNLFLLKPNEQWDLFSYFLPHKQGSDEELLEHRATITDFDPPLPQRAGRAYAKLLVINDHMPAYLSAVKAQPKAKKKANKTVTIYSEVKPELDPAAFARIFTTYVYDQELKKQAEQTDQET